MQMSGRSFTLCMIGLAVLVALLGWPAHAHRPAAKESVKTKILNSRHSVAKALGQPVADQIPATFSFDLYALVWIDLPADKVPRLQIETLPADRPLRLSISGALRIEANRQTTALIFTLRSDTPCMGGAYKPRKTIEQCHKRLAQSTALAKKTLRLFATPRQRLKRVEVQRRRMPPRPSVRRR